MAEHFLLSFSSELWSHLTSHVRVLLAIARSGDRDLVCTELVNVMSWYQMCAVPFEHKKLCSHSCQGCSREKVLMFMQGLTPVRNEALVGGSLFFLTVREQQENILLLKVKARQRGPLQGSA